MAFQPADFARIDAARADLDRAGADYMGWKAGVRDLRDALLAEVTDPIQRALIDEVAGTLRRNDKGERE